MNTLEISLYEFCLQAAEDTAHFNEAPMIDNGWDTVPVHGMSLKYTKDALTMYVYLDGIEVYCSESLLFKV